MPSEKRTERPTNTPPTGTPEIQPTIEPAALEPIYTNFARVTGSPEELILDFGLNPEMGQVPTESIKLTQRLVMNFWTAKRLLSALHFAVQRHESFFGALEVDVQRRLRPGAGRPATS